MNTAKNSIKNKKIDLRWVALITIFTVLNILMPIIFFFAALDYSVTHTAGEALGYGLWFWPYFPFAFALNCINFKAILFYNSILRSHGTVKILFFIILFLLFINIIYFGIGFLIAIFSMISSFPAFMALFLTKVR